MAASETEQLPERVSWRDSRQVPGAAACSPIPSIADRLGSSPHERGGCVFVLFTRVPVTGKVKTRLVGCMTPEEAANLQFAMALDTAERLSLTGEKVVLCHSDEWREVEGGKAVLDSFISRIREACPGVVAVMQQRGADMGQRMANAVDDAFSLGVSRCLLVGSDVPTMMPADAIDACRRLDGDDVVFGPCGDGGFWVVGVNEPFPALFEAEGYGTGSALEAELSICESHGKTVAFARRLFVVDDEKAFVELCDLARQGDDAVGPHTRAACSSIGQEVGKEAHPWR